MTTKQDAANKIYNTIVTLLLAYDAATSSDKASISRSLTGLYAEHAALKGDRNLLNQPYSVLTKQFAASKKALQKVTAARKRLENALVTAAEILAATTAVLALFA